MERPPNIRHLAAFAATVQHGSVTRAALAVNLTQPALTQAIAGLEQSLDCRLFERGPGGMLPTAPASLLYPRAQKAIDLIGSPRITASQLRAFLALARAGSYSVAAMKTGLSTSTVHRAVADLSLALGERLVERRGRHLALTRAGERRARNLGLAMAELRSGYAEVAGLLGRSAGRILIGALPLSRARWLPQAVLAFRETHGSVDIVILEGSHAELVGPLRDGEIDVLLGALRSEDVPEDLEQEAAFADRPQLIMRKGHPLAATLYPSVDVLREHAWALPGEHTPLRRYWQEMMASDGGQVPKVSIECGSVLMIRELLLDSNMLTLLSPDQLRVELAAGLLTAREPPAAIARTIGFITRRDWHPTGPQRDMLEILRGIARTFS